MVDKLSFMVPVDRRDAATLLPIIHQRIAPCRNYSNFGSLVGMQGYQHLTVNHTYNFIDPITGACTNHMWQKAKQRYETHREVLDTCLDKFMWRQVCVCVWGGGGGGGGGSHAIIKQLYCVMNYMLPVALYGHVIILMSTY